ncbi:orotidine-5'-phosphate decarboxylase, partial [Kineococcus sp. T13]|uniref:orotidine-5'-phosphate decarboxylase n=1 Tax=Kineococcus vitellinus TaxID=2696565 RepID=UPI0014126C5B|nr:orotidine-5'-phosphate decarboxylase [Kineococcus vitellinus]
MSTAAGARFGARLAAAVGAHGPLCAGIDPHPSLLAAWGLPDDASGLERFGRAAVEALAGHVACVKPQAAFFERHGSRGVAALERLLADARAAGLLTIVDAKRGDIGSTMDGYAEAFAGDSPLAGDAVTLSPYLGFGSLRPVLDLAAANGRGVFVLALTSNPEGASVQHATGPDGRSVARVVAESAAAENAGARPHGDVGLVVGATVGPAVADLGIDLAAVNGPLLAPGFGAQGATAEDLRRVFGQARHLVLAASSREVLRAGPDAAALRGA